MNALRAISYFSIFKYPLTFDEIFNFSEVENQETLSEELTYLIKNKIIYKTGKYYSDVNNKKNIQRREIGNIKAKNVMPKALKRGQFIAKFPYVESVSISGSLSKNYFDEAGDVDFFIITKENRLWIARTLLVLYRIIFLFNSNTFFCTNYFVSKDSLKLEEKNRFTATEIATLIPVSGIKNFNSFRKENAWVSIFFPNFKLSDIPDNEKTCKFKLSKFIEFTLNSKLGDYLENNFRKLNLKRWRKKHTHLTNEEFEIAFKSNDKVSKSHPSNFQKKVLTLLNEKYLEIEKKHNIKLTLEHA